MALETEVVLPMGCWSGGSFSRTVFLRPINGEDEAFLLESAAGPLPAQQITALLARCMLGLGTRDRVTEDVARSLSIGDREALLLHLQRLTFGDKMQCILACPSPECREEMDLDLMATDLLLPPYPHPEEWHDVELHDGGHAYRVRFRLPSGGDQEAASRQAFTDLKAASSMLLRRCIGSIERNDNGHVEVISQSLENQISQMMAKLDPQAELVLNLTCPACGKKFLIVFDTAAYLLSEMNRHLDEIYREVHVLAFYYHWSESEILGMTQKKRQRYLEILDDALKEWI